MAVIIDDSLWKTYFVTAISGGLLIINIILWGCGAGGWIVDAVRTKRDELQFALLLRFATWVMAKKHGCAPDGAKTKAALTRVNTWMGTVVASGRDAGPRQNTGEHQKIQTAAGRAAHIFSFPIMSMQGETEYLPPTSQMDLVRTYTYTSALSTGSAMAPSSLTPERCTTEMETLEDT